MFGRTTRITLLLLATQLASGCCCCHRPWFWRFRYQGGCCEPCTTCCGAPPVTYGAQVSPPGVPVYGAGPAVPMAPAVVPGPVTNPTTDRMQPISSAVLHGNR
jgi:hypothetical protein